jgi:hypothetical protein
MSAVALDTSVAIPLLAQTHRAHAEVVRWWDGRPVVLSGHAVVETFSVRCRGRPCPAGPSVRGRSAVVTDCLAGSSRPGRGDRMPQPAATSLRRRSGLVPQR